MNDFTKEELDYLLVYLTPPVEGRSPYLEKERTIFYSLRKKIITARESFDE